MDTCREEVPEDVDVVVVGTSHVVVGTVDEDAEVVAVEDTTATHTESSPSETTTTGHTRIGITEGNSHIISESEGTMMNEKTHIKSMEMTLMRMDGIVMARSQRRTTSQVKSSRMLARSSLVVEDRPINETRTGLSSNPLNSPSSLADKSLNLYL